MKNAELFNFGITSGKTISREFLKRDIADFSEAANFVRLLPYRRNPNKDDLITVFLDGFGTCSTKHALLKQLAIENGEDAVCLMLGIFRMNKLNTPVVAATLEEHSLEFIPEAHNYLKVGGEIIDCTSAQSHGDNFVADLVSEIEILPEQITDFKVNYHKLVLRNWLAENPQISYSLDELFAIREQCIRDISVTSSIL